MISDVFLGWERGTLLRRVDLIAGGLAAEDSRAKHFTINFGDRFGPAIVHLTILQQQQQI